MAADFYRNVLGMYKEFCYLVSSLKNYPIIYHFLNLLNHDNQKTDEVSFRLWSKSLLGSEIVHPVVFCRNTFPSSKITMKLLSAN